jgi:hypothetical protein
MISVQADNTDPRRKVTSILGKEPAAPAVFTGRSRSSSSALSRQGIRIPGPEDDQETCDGIGGGLWTGCGVAKGFEAFAIAIKRHFSVG